MCVITNTFTIFITIIITLKKLLLTIILDVKIIDNPFYFSNLF